MTLISLLSLTYFTRFKRSEMVSLLWLLLTSTVAVAGTFSDNVTSNSITLDNTASGNTPSDAHRYQRVQTALRWSLIPGAGHRYLGDELEANRYAGALLSLTAAGYWLEDRNKALDRDQVNLFWLMGFKGWELSVFTTYRSALERNGFQLDRLRVDDSPVSELVKAPFQRQHLVDPWVWGAAVFGAAVGLAQSADQQEEFRDIRRVEILGGTANRAWGSVAYGSSAFLASLGAGVAEEALWRGVLQNQMEHRFGQQTGLWLASGLFGSAHLVGLNGSSNVRGGVFATAAGYYLGRLFQRSDYQLAKPIAAHFWYNFAVMTTAFLRDPEDNPLGIDFRYDF